MRAKILYSIPVFWFAGVASLAYHAVSVFLFSSKSEKTKIPKLLLPLLVFVAVYVFSLAANFYQSPVDRFVASIYNLSLWVSGIMVASSHFVYYNQMEKQAKVLIFIILAAALLCFFTNSEIILKSLVSMAISTDSLPPLIKDTVMLKVFTSDWFDESVNYRNSIFSPYSTATGAMAIILLAIATNNISSRSREFFFLFVVAFICAASTFSRISVFVVVLYAVLRLYLDLPRNYRKFLLFFAPVAIGLCLPEILATIDKINELRGGSSSIRFNMYAETFRLTMESNPIYGIAVKPRDYFFIPLGSHSTYLGAFLKTGILGMLCLIYFNLKFWKSYFSIVLKPKSQALSNTTAALCALSIFFSLEDLDAAQALSFLYFVLVGTHIGNIKSCNGNS